MKLLYAENERGISEVVVDMLKRHKYTVDTVFDGEAALAFANAENYDCLILDTAIPRISGFEIARKLRERGNRVPVLLLTSKSEISALIEDKEEIADAYLSKPFAIGELLARIHTILRKIDNSAADIVRIGNIELNLQNFMLSGKEKSVILPKLEYRIMELLMLNQNVYVSTEEVLDRVWGYDTTAEIGIVWVYISYLRRRLRSVGANVEIKAKRNIGYILKVK